MEGKWGHVWKPIHILDSFFFPSPSIPSIRLALYSYSPILCNYVFHSSLLTASAKQKAADGTLKIWWCLEEAVAQDAFYFFFCMQGASPHALLAQKKTAGWDVVSLCQGRWRKGKKAVIRGCILDCIRKLDFRLPNVPQHPRRAHRAAGVVEECRAGLRQCKHSSTSRCSQWSHLTLFGTLIYLCYSITAKANKGTWKQAQPKSRLRAYCRQ